MQLEPGDLISMRLERCLSGADQAATLKHTSRYTKSSGNSHEKWGRRRALWIAGRTMEYEYFLKPSIS